MSATDADAAPSETLPTSLNELWDEIGLTEKERSIEMRELQLSMQQVQSDYVEAKVQQCQKLKNDIAEIKKRHCALLQAVGASQSEIESVEKSCCSGTVRARRKSAQENLTSFMDTVYRPRMAAFAAWQEQIAFVTTHLGLSLDDEFSTIDETNLTLSRLISYENKARELNAEWSTKSTFMDAMLQRIRVLSHDLQEEIPEFVHKIFDSADFSDASVSKLQDLVERSEELFEERRRNVSEIAVEITKLWDLLRIEDSVRRQFLNSHTVLSQKNVEDCIKEAERLTKLRDENLPSIIRTLKSDILRICGELGFAEDRQLDVLEGCDVGEDLETFNELDSRLISLKKLKVASRHIIDLIKQRDEILAEHEELKSVTRRIRDEEKEGVEVKIKAHIERVNRRYKYVLPRVEKKLKLTLLQFREQEKGDFLWKGEPMIAKLENVQLSPSELEALKRKMGWNSRPYSARRTFDAKGAKGALQSGQRKSEGPRFHVTGK
jgi:hypothetical protein